MRDWRKLVSPLEQRRDCPHCLQHAVVSGNGSGQPICLACGSYAPDAFSTEPGADGKPQAIIPGAERISDRQLAERRMGGAIQPKARQRPADIGLFDTAARDQGDLFA